MATTLTPEFLSGGVVAASSTSQGNLLSSNQSDFLTSTGSWSPINSNLSRVNTQGDGNPGSLGLAAINSNNAEAVSGSSSTGGFVAASPGLIYTGSADSKAAGPTSWVEADLSFYNSSKQQITTVSGPFTPTSTSSWVEATSASALAPPDTAYVVLGLVLVNPQPGQEVYFDNAWIKQTVDQVPSVNGPLHTSGNEILDASGKPIILRGVVLDGLENTGSFGNVNQQAVTEAKAWGANFVRVPLGEEYWLSSNCDYIVTYEQMVDNVVTWITSLGMVALLDLHTNTVGGCEHGSPHNMADAAQAPTFWQQVASRYMSNPLVAFDVYNEPHDISNSVWLNGGTTTDRYPPNQTYQAAGMQQLYNAVRSTGSKNLVFVTGTVWGNNPPPSLVNGTNIVYAAHYYTCPGVAPPSCKNSSPNDPSQALGAWVKPSASIPVAVTEFGWPSQDDGTYINNVIALARAHNWSWSAFAWSANAGAQFNLSSWTSGGVAEPYPSGRPVLCRLAAYASGAYPCAAPPNY